MGTISHPQPPGSVLAALWLGVLVGAFMVADGLFGFEFAGPYRSPYEPHPRPTEPQVYPDDPCVPVWCSDAHREVCCEGTEEDTGGFYIAPDIPFPTPPPAPHSDTVPPDANMPEGAGAQSEEEWCRPPNYIVPCVDDETKECCAAVEMYGYSSDHE